MKHAANQKAVVEEAAGVEVVPAVQKAAALPAVALAEAIRSLAE